MKQGSNVYFSNTKAGATKVNDWVLRIPSFHQLGKDSFLLEMSRIDDSL